ncbi:MAG: hypothetical protein MJ082_05610 [Clostridia bacterium]|nr:hypothetical protein [Clostridia bacterium]
MDNLSLLNETAARTAEARICELSDLSDKLVCAYAERYRQTKSATDSFRALSVEVPESPRNAHAEMDPGNGERIRHFLSELSVFDRSVISDLLFEKLKLAGFPLTEEEFLKPKAQRERIGYVKNTLADEAFDVFSEEMTDPRVTYVPSFKEGVSALLSGSLDYLLFPLEEKGGVRLATIEKLLRDNDLKIAGVTPVFGFDGNAELTYSLVSTTIRLAEYHADDDR